MTQPTDLTELLRRAAASAPGHAALVAPGGSTTYAELDAAVDAAAHAFVGLGLGPGERVAVHLPNARAFVVAYLGAVRAGCVAVPLNPLATADELQDLLADCGAAAVVTRTDGAGRIAGLRGALPELTHVLVDGEPPRARDGEPPLPRSATVDWAELLRSAPTGAHAAGSAGEDLAALVYTAGTSGRPRAAMLSHRALLANLEQCSAIEPPVVGPDEVVLIVLPLFHIYGLNTGLGMVLRHAATAVLLERFDPVETLQAVAQHEVTVLLGAPPIFVAWSLLPAVAESLTSVRLALSGAAPIPAVAHRRLLEATGHVVFEGYGLTETAPVLTSTLLSEVARPSSIGRPLPGVELQLRDERGEEVDVDDPGEIVVRGANLFSGYWPDGSGGPDADGWWATGDIAVADEAGELHLVDRLRELILVSGFNVYPREIEERLLRHPAIAQAAVIGIPHPYTGQAVRALVVPTATGPTADELTPEDVVAWCAAALARFKCPTSVQFVDELPQGPLDKVSKGRLRALYGAVTS
ncbi:MAG: long-chain fatty-acid-CoA ligase [Mycobacterium sp.]|nr:long-chain fatty-acid-CoA ligase [Mycobacterium sp.]